MLEHLISADPAKYVPEILDSPGEIIPGEKATIGQLVDAKMRTALLLEGLAGAPDAEIVEEAQRAAAQQAFMALTQSTDTTEKRMALDAVDTPATVKHLVGMLTAYDWAFVEQAQEIRGYTVAGLMKETVHPDARIRLKALELLGKVTEIALFTERVEVNHKNVSDEELEAQLKEKLARFAAAKDITSTAVEVKEEDAP